MSNKEKEKPKQLTAKASNLSGLIDYQEGSVVSRTIIDKKTGTVTLFAFDENQGLSEHTAPYDAMVYVLEGEVDVTICRQTHKSKAGRNDHHARKPTARPNCKNKVQNASNNDKILKLQSPHIHKTKFSKQFFRWH